MLFKKPVEPTQLQSSVGINIEIIEKGLDDLVLKFWSLEFPTYFPESGIGDIPQRAVLVDVSGGDLFGLCPFTETGESEFEPFDPGDDDVGVSISDCPAT